MVKWQRCSLPFWVELALVVLVVVLMFDRARQDPPRFVVQTHLARHHLAPAQLHDPILKAAPPPLFQRL